MLETVSLFDSMEQDDTQRRVASRRALALAHNRVESHLGAFLRGARSVEEFEERLALVLEDFTGYVATASAEVGHDHPEHIAAALKDVYKLAADKVEFVPTDEEHEQDDEEKTARRRQKEAALPLPTDPQGMHDHLMGLDQEFGTSPQSPLHHDNRVCPLCGSTTGMSGPAGQPPVSPDVQQSPSPSTYASTTGGWSNVTPLAVSHKVAFPYQDMHEPESGPTEQSAFDAGFHNHPCRVCGEPYDAHGPNEECPGEAGYRQEQPEYGWSDQYPNGHMGANNPSDQRDNSYRLVTCPECGGDGNTAGATQCRKCAGKGKVPNFGDSMLDHVAAGGVGPLGPNPYDIPGDNFFDQHGQPGLDPMRNPQGYIRPSVPHPLPSAQIEEGYEEAPNKVNPQLGPGELGRREYGEDAGLQIGPNVPAQNWGRLPQYQGADQNNTGLGGPEPKIDKSHGTPDKPKVDDKVHPTKEKDITEPIKATNEKSLSEIGDIKSEKLPANSGDAGFNSGGPGLAPHTDTFGKGNQADPVTDDTLEEKQSHSLAALMSSDWPSDSVVHAAFARLR